MNIKDTIRAAGGIIHSDGNIFFTRAEQFLAAAAHFWSLVIATPARILSWCKTGAAIC